MEINELPFMSIRDLSSLIEKKKISIVELVETYLERIARLQPRLNAYITVCGEEALTRARELDNSLARGTPAKKPLFGIPIALKDQIDTRGLVTTYGSQAFSDHIPEEDATVVARLKEAGAIVLGKSNMTGAPGEAPPFGQPRNPWNTARSPGGSSSGSGVAVSSGLCAASIGEDTAGSARIPANHCGVVGLRPSSGLVSRYGIHPISPSLDTAGPLGRRASDCAILLQVIAGYDPKDALSSRRPVPDYLKSPGSGIEGIRIGVIREFMDDRSLDAEIKVAIEKAVEVLSELGASLEEVTIPNITSSMYAAGVIIWAEEAALNRKWFESKYRLFSQSARVSFLAGCLLPAKAYILARQAQALIRGQILEAFQKYDLLLCPNTSKPTPNIEEATKAAVSPTSEDVLRRHADGHIGFAPLAGCPAISVPCGFSETGLPLGLQLCGRPFEDNLVLLVAHAYEESTNWQKNHPDL